MWILEKYLAPEECIVGKVYSLKSRNLKMGVYTSDKSFIGIRYKFGSLFLDKELHWDSGGTAKPLLLINQVPDTIPLKIDLGSYDLITGLDVKFDKPIDEGGKGWYFVDTGNPSREIRPVRKSNSELFNLLKDLDENPQSNHAF